MKTAKSSTMRAQSARKATRSLAQLMNLSHRHALVTGGAGHIGSQVSGALMELGATVAIMDQDVAACRQRSRELTRRHPKGRAIPLPCDLSDEQATRAAVRQAAKQMGGLGILVHCAAYVGTTQVPGWAVPLDQQTVKAWDAAMRVNLTAAFVLVQEASKLLASSRHGSVILFASTYGLVGPDFRLYEGTSMANPAGYAASKGGVLQLTRYLATALAPKVRVNAITPGGLWRHQPKVFHQRYILKTPRGRMATDEGMLGAVAYLARDLSAYVTGHNLVVDGGWTAW